MPRITTCPMSSRDMVYEDENMLTVEIEQLHQHLQHRESQRIDELPEMLKKKGLAVAEIARMDQLMTELVMKKKELLSVLKQRESKSSRLIMELQRSKQQLLRGMTFEALESSIEHLESTLCIETMSLKEEKWLVEETACLRRARSQVQALDYQECVESIYLKNLELDVTSQIVSIDAKLKKVQQKRAARSEEVAKVSREIELRRSIKARLIRMQHRRKQLLAEQAIEFCMSMMSEAGSTTCARADDCAKAVEDEGIDAGSHMLTSAMKQFREEEKNGVLEKVIREEDLPSCLTATATSAKKMDAGSRKSKRNVMHTMQSFNIFAKLRIDPPMTTDELPNTLAKLLDVFCAHQSKAEQAPSKKSGFGGA